METKYDGEGIPPSHRPDVEKAVKILEGAGCSEIYLFGSIVTGPVTPESDIDLTVKGITTCFLFQCLWEINSTPGPSRRSDRPGKLGPLCTPTSIGKDICTMLSRFEIKIGKEIEFENERDRDNNQDER